MIKFFFFFALNGQISDQHNNVLDFDFRKDQSFICFQPCVGTDLCFTDSKLSITDKNNKTEITTSVNKTVIVVSKEGIYPKN